MGARGTYRVRLAHPSGKEFNELVQANSKAEAAKSIKIAYPLCAHLETITRVMSEGEENKARAIQETAAIKRHKEEMDQAVKDQIKRDVHKADKKVAKK